MEESGVVVVVPVVVYASNALLRNWRISVDD
jgi:hypothetical protein